MFVGFSNNPGGVASNNRMSGNVVSYNAPGTDDGVIADCNAAKNRCASTNPNAIPNRYWLGPEKLTVVFCGVLGVVNCVNPHLRANFNVVPNRDLPPVHENGVVINKQVVAHRNITAHFTHE